MKILNETDGTGMDSLNPSKYPLSDNTYNWQIEEVLYNEYGGLQFDAKYIPTGEIINFRFKDDQDLINDGGQWILDELESQNLVDDQFNVEPKEELSIEDVQDNTDDNLIDVSANSSNDQVIYSQASDRDYIEDGDNRGDGLNESTLPKKGSTVYLGTKRSRSSWKSKMRKGTKMIVLDNTDTLDKEPVLTLAFADEYNKSDFDPEMDYEMVYPNELKESTEDDKRNARKWWNDLSINQMKKYEIDYYGKKFNYGYNNHPTDEDIIGMWKKANGKKESISLIKEENINHMSLHDWNSIIQSIDAQMIHMHPEFGEIEFMFNDCHYLIELEGDELNLCCVEDVDSMTLNDDTTDIDIAQQLDGMLDVEEEYVDALEEKVTLTFPVNKGTTNILNGERVNLNEGDLIVVHVRKNLNEAGCPKPKSGESKEDFVSRAMEAMKGDDKSQDQKLAIAYSEYENKKESVKKNSKSILKESLIQVKHENSFSDTLEKFKTSIEVIIKFETNNNANIHILPSQISKYFLQNIGTAKYNEIKKLLNLTYQGVKSIVDKNLIVCSIFFEYISYSENSDSSEKYLADQLLKYINKNFKLDRVYLYTTINTSFKNISYKVS